MKVSETIGDYSYLNLIEFDLDKIRDKNYLTHNFHPYPAKFIPQFPKRIIKVLSSKGQWVLDPFCGCGTTLVEAKLLGRNSVGIDVNPIAALVSKVKTTTLDDDQLKAIKGVLSSIGQMINRHYGTQPLFRDYSHVKDFKIPEFFNRDHWFKKCVQNELAIIKAIVNEIRDEDVKDFMLVAFSAIITSVSNQESDTRYAKKDKNIKEFDTYKAFYKKVIDMIERMKRFSKVATDATVSVYEADSRNISFINNETIDLVMTSPPYLNAYDYYLYHKLRMYWLGMDHYKAQDLEIGSRHKHSDNNLGVNDYFENIEKCLKEIYRVLKPKSYCCIVIGDAIKDGNYVKMDDHFEFMAKEIGFCLRKKLTYPLRKYTRAFTKGFKTIQKNGYIMIFQK
jgi:site-specific DNA-methyltransferase (cytosine-N4-specific)